MQDIYKKKKFFVVCRLLIWEIIQNADDVGARTVRFSLDSWQHKTESLVQKRLQGPALLAYNDAEFKHEDWKGIQ